MTKLSISKHELNRENQWAFFKIEGFAGKRSLLSPPLSPYCHLFALTPFFTRPVCEKLIVLPEFRPLHTGTLAAQAMATPVRNRPVMHCKPLSIEYFMYVFGLCLLFDFATKNLRLATIFYHLVDKWRLKNFVNFEPCVRIWWTYKHINI